MEATTKFVNFQGQKLFDGPEMIVIYCIDRSNGRETVCVLEVPNHEEWRDDIANLIQQN